MTFYPAEPINAIERHSVCLIRVLGLVAVFAGSAVVKADVTAVSGSAYGYFSLVSLFGGPPSPRGPAPTVTLAADASNSPTTASSASGLAQYGPAIIFSSDQLDVSTQGTLGPSGSVTSSANIKNVNKSGNEVFTATNVAGTCSASASSGVTGSTTITNGTLQTSDGNPDVEGDETIVTIPTNPAPNTTYNGTINSVGDSFRYVFNEQKLNPDGSLTVNAAHLYLLGPTAVGDLFIGQSVCGVTATATRADFNRDAFTDYLLFNPSNQKTAVWFLQGKEFLAGRYGPTLPAGWAVVSVADVNRDGQQDYIVFNASTRRTAVWFLHYTNLVDSAFGPTLPANWELVSAIDFNGDAKPDFVLFNPTTRQTAIWSMNGAVFMSSVYGPTVPSGWTLIDALEFNANNRPDFVLFNRGTRRTAIWYLDSNTFIDSAYGPTLPSGWTLQGAADFNSDAKPDFVLSEPATRRTAIWYLNGPAFITGAYGPTLASGYQLAFP